MPTCVKCQTEFTGNYCYNCGHPVQPKRITGNYILSEIGSVLNFQKGILYTIKGLAISPGSDVRKFIGEDRNRLVKPILFILICSLAYSLIISFFGIHDGYMDVNAGSDSAITAIYGWVSQNYGYANIIMGLFISLWIKLFFRKYDYNIFEILILMCFVMGMAMLLYAVCAIVEGVSGWSTMQIGGVLGFAYCIWAIGQFFNSRKFMSYFKALLAYILGFLTFSILATSLGLVIDMISK